MSPAGETVLYFIPVPIRDSLKCMLQDERLYSWKNCISATYKGRLQVVLLRRDCIKSTEFSPEDPCLVNLLSCLRRYQVSNQ